MRKTKTTKVLLVLTLVWAVFMAAFTVSGVTQSLGVALEWELTLGPTIGLAAVFGLILGGFTVLSTWVLYVAATEPIDSQPAVQVTSSS